MIGLYNNLCYNRSFRDSSLKKFECYELVLIFKVLINYSNIGYLKYYVRFLFQYYFFVKFVFVFDILFINCKVYLFKIFYLMCGNIFQIKLVDILIGM